MEPADMQEHWGYDSKAVVELLYRLLLNREPDPAGLEFHTRSLEANRFTPQQLARAFVASDEFTGVDRARRGDVCISCHGCDFVLPAGGAAIGEMASDEGYEPWVLPYFLECCRPGMTVVDIGASWGAFALPAARRVGQGGRVFAFEVSAKNCQVMLKSLKASSIDNVHVLPLGISDRLGAELLRRQDVTNNNAISTGEDADAAELDQFDVVAVTPLDLLRGALGPVHILKMDIEGMEYRASVGALSLLKDQRPVSFVEYSPRFQRIGSGVDGAELLGLFLDLEYQIEILHRHAPRERVVGANSNDIIALVDAAWSRHVDQDQGTHLDLCLRPAPRTA